MPPGKKRILVCCVPHCGSRESLYGEDDNGLKLYKFPSEKPLMRKWVAKIGRGANFIPTERSRICSKHFQTGKKSYKPTNVDYIPSIFWYNTVKTSEFCSGCRRKVCRCNIKDSEPELGETEEMSGCTDDFSEKEMYQLLRTIEAETEALDGDGNAAPDPTYDMDVDRSSHSDVTNAIASFLADEYIVPDEEASDNSTVTILHKSDPKTSASRGVKSEESELVRPIERNNVDETIDCCVRGEDSVGEEILLRQYKRGILAGPSEIETDMVNDLMGGIEEHVREDMELLGSEPPSPRLVCMDEAGRSVPCLEEDANHKQAAEPPPVRSSYFGSVRPNSKTYLQLAPHEIGTSESELEVEWKRRERLLVKQHKVEEKNMVLEMIRKTQTKNQTIDELKQEIKQLKKEKKSIQLSRDALDHKIRSDYEEQRKEDIKNLLAEANSNLFQLQTKWTEEKRVLIEANSALAALCKMEDLRLDQLQAEFVISTISASSSTKTGDTGDPKLRISEARSARVLRYESCSDSADSVKYFTGMPTAPDFDALYSVLEGKAKTMRYWNGKSWIANPPIGKRIKTPRIDLKNQLFLTLTRYKRGFTTKELGFFFNCDPVYVSCLFITFSKLIENELVELFKNDYDHATEFNGLPEIVQTHYPKLYATLRVIEIRLENRPTFVALNSKSVSRKAMPTFKILFLSTPNGNVFFISPVYPGSTSDRDVILESKVLDMIPQGSEIFVEKQFDVSNECINKEIQLLVFPQESSHPTLSEDDPWEIKLMIKCKSRMEKLVGLMRYFRIFDNELHLTGTNTHSPTVIRVVLLLQHYIDTKCTPPVSLIMDDNVVLIRLVE